MAKINTNFKSYNVYLQLFCGEETSARMEGCIDLLSSHRTIYNGETGDAPAP